MDPEWINIVSYSKAHVVLVESMEYYRSFIIALARLLELAYNLSSCSAFFNVAL